MNFLRRTARVYANEGLPGVATRVVQKLLRSPSGGELDRRTGEMRRRKMAAEIAAAELRAAELRAARDTYARQAKAFEVRVRELGCADLLANYYWYHTVDLGNGLVTPGDYDFRPIIQDFPFPEDMTGMHVLDVGSATGFFAFEFERRGADVVSVELPSLESWDMVAAERRAVLDALLAYHRAATVEEATRCHLHGPFDFCHRLLNSKVRRCYSTVYDLTPAKLGRDQFDLIYLGDVMPHLFSPLKALDVLASVCGRSMVLTMEAVPSEKMSEMFFVGQSPDCRSWWRPNVTCARDMLKRVGFTSVDATARIKGLLRREWVIFSREILHAQCM